MAEVAILINARNQASAVLKKISGDLDDVKRSGADAGKGIDTATGSLDEMPASADKANKATSGLKTAMGLLAGAGVAAAVAAVKSSIDLNASMANVASLGVSTERVNELKTSVQDLAIATGKSTDDIAGGLYQVISAFGDTADTVGILRINAKAAAAGLATTEDAINLTSAVTKGYGDTSADAVQHVSDLAFLAVKLGQTTFPDLAASIGKVTPFSKELNISQEELFATFATATGVMGGAAEVSTGLRSAMQGLMSPTKDMAALISKLGYENGAALVKSEGMKGAFDLIAKAAKDSGKPLTAYMSSIEGAGLVALLAGEQSDAYIEKLAEMAKAAGATDEAFAAQTEGVNKLGFVLQQTRQKGMVLLQRVGDALAPTLLFALEKGVLPMVDGLFSLVDGFVKMSEGGDLFQKIFDRLPDSIQIPLRLVGQLAASLGDLWRNIQKHIDIKKIWSQVKLAFGALITFDITKMDVGKLAKSVKDAIKSVDWQEIKDDATSIFGGFAGAVHSALGKIDWPGILKNGAELFGKLVSTVGAWLSNINWGDIAASGASMFVGLVSFVGQKIQSINWTGIAAEGKGLFDGMISFIGAKISAINWTGMAVEGATIFAGLVSYVGGKLSQINWSALSSGGKAAMGGAKSLFTGLVQSVGTKLAEIDWTTIGTGVSDLWQGLKDEVAAMLPTPESFWSGDVMGGVKEVVDQLFGENGIFQQVSKSIIDGISAADSLVKNADAKGMAEAFNDIIGGVMPLVLLLAEADFAPAGERINAMTGLGTSIVNFLTTFADGIDPTAITDAIGSFALNFGDEMKAAMGDGELLDLGAAVGAFVSTIVGKIGDALASPGFGSDVGKGAGEAIGALAKGAMQIVTGIADELAKTDWETVKSQVGEFVKGFIKGFSEAMAEADFGPIWQAMIKALGTAVGVPQGGQTMPAGLANVPGIAEAAAGITVKLPELTPDFWPPIPGPKSEWWPQVPTQQQSIYPAMPKQSDSMYPAIPKQEDSMYPVMPKQPQSIYPEIPKLPSSWWPEIKMPSWVSKLLQGADTGPAGVSQAVQEQVNKQNQQDTGGGGGGDFNAMGTGYFRGGLTLVGERGPELIAAPRGSAIYSNNDSKRMMESGGGWSGPLANTIVVNSEADIYRIAYAVTDIQNRRRGRG